MWRNGVLEAEDFPFEQVSDYLEQEGCLVWADLCRPDAEALASIAEELSLDPHAIEDATSPHERPKATRYMTHLFFSTYALRSVPGQHEPHLTHVSAFCTRNALVTVRSNDGFDIDELIRRWDDNADLVKYGPRALEYGMLDMIVDEYFEFIETLDDAIEDLEGAIFDENPTDPRELQLKSFRLRKGLLRLRRVVLPMREVANTVARRATANDPSNELTPYFEDLYDHILRAAEWTESLRDMMSSIFETNMALADTRLNQIMKQLTAWAAIIAVPTAITGFFGQNVPYPGFGEKDGFWASIVLMALIAATLYALFRKRDWL